MHVEKIEQNTAACLRMGKLRHGRTAQSRILADLGFVIFSDCYRYDKDEPHLMRSGRLILKTYIIIWQKRSIVSQWTPSQSRTLTKKSSSLPGIRTGRSGSGQNIKNLER